MMWDAHYHTLFAFASIISFSIVSQGRLLIDSAGKQITNCPVQCEFASEEAGNWTYHRDVQSALQCRDRSVILDYAVFAPLDSSPGRYPVRSCFTFQGDAFLVADGNLNYRDNLDHNVTIHDQLASHPPDIYTRLDTSPRIDGPVVQIDWAESSNATIPGQMIGALSALLPTLQIRRNLLKKPILLNVQYGDVFIGLYSGDEIITSSSEQVIHRLIDQFEEGQLDRLAAFQGQHCGGTPERTFGLLGFSKSTNGNLSLTQDSLGGWSNGLCRQHLDELELVESTTTTTLPFSSARRHHMDFPFAESYYGYETTKNSSLLAVERLQPTRRSFARSQKLAPNPDGSCATYFVQAGDTCGDLADHYGIGVDDLERFNAKTWSWSNCGMLWAGINICLSEGAPPMPASVPDTQCGPIVPGTQRPTDGTDLAQLNPCPLKACCDVWGYCGTTDEFCTVAPNGGPGTTQPGVASCIFNCGTKITNVGTPPKSFSKVAYYECWNYDRSCLRMDPRQIDDSYTHVHYAFATIDETFTISIAGERNRFSRFQEIRGKKKIITLGGWAQSTEPATYALMRNAVLPANRARFAENIAYSVNFFDLDGVDIDWEYPGEQDMPDISHGSPDDGMNYLALLKEIRSRLPNKSISIAAPASFWYLKAFPIEQISSVVDYVVYMTYDLNEQWSYGNKWALTACDNGNCLRSHVNFTETMNDLTMITKAGVASNKIVVGIPSYGRSFKMENPNCRDPTCFFTGPKSGATPGRCTATPGILAKAEIDEIISKDPSARTYEIDDVSNILIYGGDQWVSYVDQENVQRRIEYYRGLNFAGIADWAVDQAAFLPDLINLPSQEDEEQAVVDLSWRMDRNKKEKSIAEQLTNLPQNLPWMQQKCTHPAMKDETGIGIEDKARYQAWRWKEMRADEAWAYCLDIWERKIRPEKTHYAFMREFANLIHAAPIDCSLTVAGSCNDPGRCWDDAGTGPAAQLMLESLMTIHREMLQLYTGFGSAQSNLTDYLTNFTKVFAPTPKSDKLFDVFVGLGQFGLQLIAAPAFNRCKCVHSRESNLTLMRVNGFKNMPYFTKSDANKEELGIFKDTTGAVITMAGNMMKGTTGKQPLKQEIIFSELNTLMPEVVKNWQTSILATHNALFMKDVGKHETDILYGMIRDGRMISAEQDDDFNVTQHTTSIIIAGLLPTVWRFQALKPVLVDSEMRCEETGARIGRELGAEVAAYFSACVNGRRYYLIAPSKAEERFSCSLDGGSTNGHGKNTPCVTRGAHLRFESMPGIDELPKWGELTRDILAESAVAGYKLWGNRGPPDGGPSFMDDAYSKAALPALRDPGKYLTMPGAFTVPVCTLMT